MFTQAKVEIIGHVGSFEAKDTRNQKRMATLSVANSESWKNKETGDYDEKTNWTRCVAFKEATAKFIEENMKKGRYVRIVGKLVNNAYETDGETRYSSEVHVDQIDFLDKKPSDQGDDQD